jgi:predicted nucleotidyltransferase
MAIRKSELNQYIGIPEKDYLTLLEDHITLRALKIAGIENMPIYKSVDSIIKDGRIEIHMKPVKQKYR